MKKQGNIIGRLVEGAIGIYLMLPGPEDVGTGGLTIAPSFILGTGMLLHAISGKKL